MNAKRVENSATHRLGRAATIRDVAARAGVSVATVSRALNNTDVVREETSRSVLDAAKALRYVANTAARSLSVRRMHTVGVLLPDVHGQFFSEVIRGADAAARAAGFHLLVSGWHSDSTEMFEVIQTMRGRVDGLLLMAPNLSLSSLREEMAFNLPLVLLNSNDRKHAAVTIDNYGGAGTMMRHLASLGHKRIGFLKGPSHNVDAWERLRGYRHAMRKAGAAENAVELNGDFTEESGRAAARTLLERGSLPTALFAANDSMAIGLISELTQSGVDVPGDIAVAGFDDIAVARYITPALTTMHVDISNLGARAFALLLTALQDGIAHHELISTSLVVRTSCGARSIKPVEAATASVAKRRK